MGQAESKETEQNPGHAPQHARRNTVHGAERTRRPTPPIANPVPKRPTETKRTTATPGGPSSAPRLGNTPQTFPRSRALTSVRPRMSPAPQRQAPVLPRTTGRLLQQFAVRPTPITASSTSSPSLPTSRSQPIPISQPVTRSRPERPAPDRSRPARRSAPPAKTAAQATDSDAEPTGPPAKRVTRSRTAVPTAEKTPTAPTPSTSTTTGITASDSSTTAPVAVAGPSTTKKRPRNKQPLDDEPTNIGDVEPESADDGEDKMSMSSDESGASSDEDESDDAASRSSDSSDDGDELDLELDGPEEDGQESDSSVEKGPARSERSVRSRRSVRSQMSVRSRATPARRPAGATAARPAAAPAAAAESESQFALRRSRRRSVPVRHLQVDPHRASYVSV